MSSALEMALKFEAERDALKVENTKLREILESASKPDSVFVRATTFMGREYVYKEDVDSLNVIRNAERKVLEAQLATLNAAAKRARVICERGDDLNKEEVLGEISEALAVAMSVPDSFHHGNSSTYILDQIRAGNPVKLMMADGEYEYVGLRAAFDPDAVRELIACLEFNKQHDAHVLERIQRVKDSEKP